MLPVSRRAFLAQSILGSLFLAGCAGLIGLEAPLEPEESSADPTQDGSLDQPVAPDDPSDADVACPRALPFIAVPDAGVRCGSLDEHCARGQACCERGRDGLCDGGGCGSNPGWACEGTNDCSSPFAAECCTNVLIEPSCPLTARVATGEEHLRSRCEFFEPDGASRCAPSDRRLCRADTDCTSREECRTVRVESIPVNRDVGICFPIGE